MVLGKFQWAHKVKEEARSLVRLSQDPVGGEMWKEHRLSLEAMQPQTAGLNLMRVLMLPHKMAKYHMTGTSEQERKGAQAFLSPRLPVVTKMQLTYSPFCDRNNNLQELSLSPPPHHITYSFQKAPPHHNNQVSNTHCTVQWQAH